MTIGAALTTYNDLHMTMRCVDSIIRNRYGYIDDIVVVDDGSSNGDHLDTLDELLSARGVKFVCHEDNKGIPAAWNTCTKELNTDIVILFNNDIVISNQYTFQCMKYFFENNNNLGSVGWNLIQVDPFSGVRSQDVSETNDELQEPGHVGAAVGCSFGFRKEAWAKVGGLWEELVSFHEETDFGFKLAMEGLYSYQLPYPSVEHHGSMTFRNNLELAVMRFNDKVADREEYIATLSNPKFHKKIGHLPDQMRGTGFIWNDARGSDLVYRMDFSRFLFAKKYGVLDFWDEPQVEVHRRIIDPMPKNIPLKWLNKNMEECIIDKDGARRI